jgi:hypothetical protein
MENNETNKVLTKTHWKKLVNPDYLGAYSLQPKEEKVLTIDKVVREIVKGTGGKKQECTILYFVEKEKPMILNRLNSKIITKIYGTPYIEEWVTKKIQIFADMVDAFGEQVEALRIRPFIPTIALPILTEQMKAFDNAKQHINAGGSIEDIEKRFQLTDEIKKKITNA